MPLDFSPASSVAIPSAQSLAQRTGAILHLIYVHGFDYPAPIGMVPPVPGTGAETKQRFLRHLAGVVGKSELRGMDVECHVRTGIAFDQVCRLAAEIGADMIVTSTHGHTGWKRLFLGSTAERIVRHAPCPVLVARRSSIRGSRAPSVTHIVVPLDFSRKSEIGLRFAVKLAAVFGASITLLHVISRDRYLTPEGAVMFPETELLRDLRRAAKERLQKVIRATDFGEVPNATAVRVGLPEEEICRFGEKNAADLIVTATHGRTGLGHVLLGSVAEHIVRYAKGPVLTVPTRRGAKA